VNCAERLKAAAHRAAILSASNETSQSVRRATSPHARSPSDSFSRRPFELSSLGEADLAEIAAILFKYKGLGIQLADASVYIWQNREGIETIFTLDRRDFNVLRPARGKKFCIVP
jgi:predicted nucleic acid-binding protein